MEEIGGRGKKMWTRQRVPRKKKMLLVLLLLARKKQGARKGRTGGGSGVLMRSYGGVRTTVFQQLGLLGRVH